MRIILICLAFLTLATEGIAAGRFDVNSTFGAVCNGTTDDAAAFNSAFAAAKAAGGGKINFSGVCAVKSSLNYTNLPPIILEGDGAGSSVIKALPGTYTKGVIYAIYSDHISFQNLTVDQNNITLPSGYPAINVVASNDVRISDAEVTHFTFMGIGLDSVTRYWVRDTYVSRDAKSSAENYCFLSTSTLSATEDGKFYASSCKNSGLMVNGNNLQTFNNRVDGNGFGADFVTGANGIFNILASNIGSGGTGVDVNNTYIGGAELNSPYSSSYGNIFWQNAGSGIVNFGRRGQLFGNVTAGNGTNASAPYRSGLVDAYSSPTYGGSYSNYAANFSYDLGAGSQKYGYQQQSTLLTSITLQANQFQSNAIAPVSIIGTGTVYTGQ